MIRRQPIEAGESCGGGSNNAEVRGTRDGYCVKEGLGWCEQDGLCREQPGPLRGGWCGGSGLWGGASKRVVVPIGQCCACRCEDRCAGRGKRRRAVPVGIMTDSAVAEADLMTLPPVRELRFSAVESPESCWCRARRSTKSLVALGADGSSSFGGCSSPAFDLLPIGEGRERGDDSSPTSQDSVPGTPAFAPGPQGRGAATTTGTSHPHHPAGHQVFCL